MDIGNQMRIWHEIRSEALRNDVFSAFLFSNAKNNMFAGHYEPTQLPIRKITNIAQKLKMLGTENPFIHCLPGIRAEFHSKNQIFSSQFCRRTFTLSQSIVLMSRASTQGMRINRSL